MCDKIGVISCMETTSRLYHILMECAQTKLPHRKRQQLERDFMTVVKSIFCAYQRGAYLNPQGWWELLLKLEKNPDFSVLASDATLPLGFRRMMYERIRTWDPETFTMMLSLKKRLEKERLKKEQNERDRIRAVADIKQDQLARHQRLTLSR